MGSAASKIIVQVNKPIKINELIKIEMKKINNEAEK